MPRRKQLLKFPAADFWSFAGKGNEFHPFPLPLRPNLPALEKAPFDESKRPPIETRKKKKKRTAPF
jgi:hypothetical protein